MQFFTQLLEIFLTLECRTSRRRAFVRSALHDCLISQCHGQRDQNQFDGQGLGKSIFFVLSFFQMSILKKLNLWRATCDLRFALFFDDVDLLLRVLILLFF